MQGPFKLPYEIHKMPIGIGLYFISWRLPTDYEIGDSKRDTARFRADAEKRIKEGFAAQRRRRFIGEIKEEKLGLHLRSGMQLSGRPIYLSPKTLRDLPLEQALTLETVRVIFGLASPLYIGMTKQQTLQERLTQHIKNETQLGTSMHSYGLSWNETEVRVLVLPQASHRELRELEKIAQSLLNPLFSSI